MQYRWGPTMCPFFASICLVSIVSSFAMPHAAEPTTVSLANAVKTFNDLACEDSIGKDQPPLTQDEIIAAIRWSLLHKDKLPVSDKNLRTLSSIADSHELPQGFELEVLRGYEPNDREEFIAWSVRLRIPANPNGNTCILIRERMISSRLIGEEERKVIHLWGKKEPPGSLARAEWMRRYAQERAKAAEADRSKRK